MKKAAILVLITLLVFSSLSLFLKTQINASEEKIYSNATIENQFSTSSIMVVLDKEESFNFKEYSIDDFSEIGCEEVYQVNSNAQKLVQEKIELLKNAKTFQEINEIEKRITIHIDEYREVLFLRFDELSKEEILDKIHILERREDVFYAGPDYIYYPCSTIPNDTEYSSQWYPSMINLESAWDIETGSSNVKIGIIDTGCNFDHPDLVNRVDLFYSKEFKLNSQYGCPVNSQANDKESRYNHGTHVAGIIGAQGNNNLGVCGICWDCTLVSLCVLEDGPHIYSSSIQKAINFANDMNVALDILNISTGFADCFNQNIYDVSLNQCISGFNGLVVCAAGNYPGDTPGTDNDIYPIIPAIFSYDNLITVGYCNELDRKDVGSNWGLTTVDLFAPGNNIYSCNNDTVLYTPLRGTSFSSPIVAGVASLIKTKHPYFTPKEIKDAILNTVDIVYDSDNCSVYGPYCITGGRLNAYAALNYHCYNSYYSQYSQSKHMAYCSCGAYILENHTWTTYHPFSFGNEIEAIRPGTYSMCDLCGYISSIPII